MSQIARVVSASMASAAALGLVVATGLAPSASAEPCSGPEANAAPPAGAPSVNSPAAGAQLPTGRRPGGANDNAPLPRLGPLIRAMIQSGTQHSSPVQQQAAVVPVPPNPAAGVPATPNAAQPVPSVPMPQVQAAADPAAAINGATTSLVEWVSGPNGPNRTLQRFGISGTDLGIMWDNGDPANRQVLMAFGDTFGYCRLHGHQRRYNVLLRTSDSDLSQGIDVPNGVVGNNYSGSPIWQPGLSKQVINSIRRAPTESSVIPTAGISVGRTQYVNFMSVQNWGRDGEWSTNYSAIAMSRDNGQSWNIYPGTVRTPAPDSLAGARYAPGNENFQQGAFLRPGDGYVYSYGTPSGRGGSAFLTRVPEGFVPDVTKYQYFGAGPDGRGAWVPSNPAAATPVIPGPVGEMSVQYNTYLRQYLALYTDGANNVAARTAPTPQGPWSPPQVLVSAGQVPGGVYAPFMHPWSTGKDVYFNLSLWSAYNVMLMHTELA